MRLNYKRLGDYIEPCNKKNDGNVIKKLQGISNRKYFQKAKTNTIGIDLSKYRVVRTGQFAFNRATTRNGDKISIALRRGKDCIVSPSYRIFKSKDENILNSEYLMMWFKRPDFDRYARFKSHGSAHEFFDWEEMQEVELPIPSIEKQNEIVKEYNTIVNRITLNETLNQKLEDTAQALYKHWFVDFEFPNADGKPYKSSGGVMAYNEELDLEVPEGWEIKQLTEISEVVDSLHKTPKYSINGYPMVRVTDINSGFLDLSNTMVVDQEVFDDFSKKHKSSKGDIVVSRVGATYGEFSYAHTDDKFCLGQNTAVIIPKSIDSKLVYTVLVSSNMRLQIEKLVSGSAYSTLSLKDIRELKICFPSDCRNSIIQLSVLFLDAIFKKRSICNKEFLLLRECSELILSKMSKLETKTVVV